MDSKLPSMPTLIAGATALFMLGFGGLMTPIGPWYHALRKPRLQPPGWLFGPAWTVILGLAAWSASIAWTAAPDASTRTRVLILFLTNAVLHAVWSPLFFRLRRPDWALIEMIALWVSLVALVVGLWPIAPRSSYLILPYLIWVSFAAWLNLRIVRMNAPFD